MMAKTKTVVHPTAAASEVAGGANKRAAATRRPAPKGTVGAVKCKAAAVEREPAPAPTQVALVRPLVLPALAPMPDGPRACAIERAFYDAWGLGRTEAARVQRRNPSPNPVSVSRASLRGINPSDYVVAEKTDGVRYALLLCTDDEGKETAVMIDRACRKFEVAVRAPRRFFRGTGTLLDGELAWERRLDASVDPAPLSTTPSVGSAAGAQSQTGKETAGAVASDDGDAMVMPRSATETLVYWVFDAACVASISQRKTDDYYARMDQVVQILQKGDADDLIVAAPGENVYDLEFRPKPYEAAFKVGMVWSEDAPRLRHGTDGLILTPIRERIRTGTHWRQFKWKHHHTFDLQLRGVRRPLPHGVTATAARPNRLADAWTWGLFYLEADWTVPTPESLARGRGSVSPPPSLARAVSPPTVSTATGVDENGGPEKKQRACYINASKGVLYGRAEVAGAALDRANAARTRNVARHTGLTSTSAPMSQHTGTADAKRTMAGDEAKSLVVFVLDRDDALETLVAQTMAAQPDADCIRCIVECSARFIDAPPGWRPPPSNVEVPPGGVRMLLCSIERLRTDKSDPNIHYTVLQTILNIDESIAYATVRAMLCHRPT